MNVSKKWPEIELIIRIKVNPIRVHDKKRTTTTHLQHLIKNGLGSGVEGVLARKELRTNDYGGIEVVSAARSRARRKNT